METFVQPKITGYRQLTSEDAERINQIKNLGINLGNLVEELMLAEGTDKRWVSIGKTDLQTGLMALVRSVAQPSTF